MLFSVRIRKAASALIVSLLPWFLTCKENDPVHRLSEAEIEPLPVRARTYWPVNGWQRRTLQQAGFQQDQFQKVIDYAFTRTGTAEDRSGIRTDGFVVIKDGYLVYEKYSEDYNPQRPHLIWSVSKSILHALIGIAVKENKLSIEDSASEYLDYMKTRSHEPIKVKHLLQMSSGLDANEGYESGPLTSTVVAMLYTRGRNDMARFSGTLPVRAAPGSYVYYSSCDSNILSAVLKNAVGEDTYSDYPWTRLFNPLGMKNVVFERDSAGTFVASSYVYMTPRDLAKFGFLYLNDGVWQGRRILPEGWVDTARRVAPGYATTPVRDAEDKDAMTAHWYANTGVASIKRPPAWPDAPADMFAGQGHWGQYVFVFPTQDMVVVRTGDDRDHSFDKNRFLKLIMQSLGDQNQ